MAEQGEHEVGIAAPPPPPLPARLVDLRPLLIIGTAVWFVAFCVLLVVDRESAAFWVTLAGWGLGLLGLVISAWQRAAARRGARGAQTGL